MKAKYQIRPLISILSIFIACFDTINGQTIKRMDNETWNAIDAEIQFQFSQNNLKGLSVAVVYGGNIAFAKGYGDKNEDGDPFTIYTKSLLASVSKTITGVLMMRLEQNGDIDLDDPISDYLPDYNNSGITIRHLMAHQSGIGHYDDCPGGYDGPFDATDSYDVVLDCSVCLTPPGSNTIYTTFGNTLLGIIINHVGVSEYVTGFTGLYEAWIRDPGGLTTLVPAYDNSDPDLAEGEIDLGYWDDIGWKLPAGGFTSNILDLADFTRGLLNNVFITQATFDSMKIDQPENGVPDFDCGDDAADDYGLTFRVSGNPQDWDFKIWHNGLNSHGYSSYMMIYPNANASIVMITNTDEVTGVLNTIRTNVEDQVLCPPTRNFTNAIDWTEPRIFEGDQITGQSVITSSNTEAYYFDAEDWVRLLPGFHAPAGKVFKAIVYDGCGGSIGTD